MKTYWLTLNSLLVVSLLFFPLNSWSEIDPGLEADIIKLEKKLKKLEKKDKKRNKSLNKKFNRHLDRIKFNGFISAGIASSDVDAEHVTLIDDTKNYQADAVIGFQGTFTINPKTQAILQFVARGIDRHNVEAEWAYISHSFTPDFTVRGGRLRLPTYNISEILEVGYAYPWIRPVPEVYNQAPFTSYYGVDFYFNKPFIFGSDILFQGMNGTDVITIGDITLVAETMYGLYVNISKGPLTIRGGALVAASSLDLGDPSDLISDFGGLLTDAAALPPEQKAEFDEQLASLFTFSSLTTEFYSFGVLYDDGNLFFHAEAAKLRQLGIIPNNVSYYITMGRRFNKLMPYTIFAKQYTIDDIIFGKVTGPYIAPLANAIGFDALEHATYSFGLRYDIMSGTTIKFQLDHLTAFDKTRGNFNSIPGNDAQIFTLSVDAVF
ncbi:MAG: hypothetical protein COB04_10540 [Gammaproteobacteria bacterium]|nr:MAG: hypothetical protein COB04_10540 [Gammaproteobacteria bacterium]